MRDQHLQLLRTIELQRDGCAQAGSPLYVRLLNALERDLVDGGVSVDLLGPYGAAPVGDAVLLRLLAGVHRLVLEDRVPELAAHFPSVGGMPGPGLERSFLAAVNDHAGTLGGDLRGGVQTNEPGRAAALLAGFWEIGRAGLPLRVLEVGASAGLNLWFDRFGFRQDDWRWGPQDSPLVMESAFLGSPPRDSSIPVIAERRGCDLDPIDPATETGRNRLRSFVWPDQAARLRRLEGAVAVAAQGRARVDRQDGVSWLTDRLSEQVTGVATVVTHSIVFQYLSPEDQRSFLAVLDAAGAAATPAAPLAWLRMEPVGDRAEVRLTQWPGGQTRLMAVSGFHGPPVALR